MKIKYKLNNKIFELKPYNTNKEKEILLASSFDNEDFSVVFDILEFDASNLSLDEQKILLYKFREISSGDDINVKFACDHCGQGNDAVIEGSNFIKPGKRKDNDIKKIFGHFDEDRMSDYLINNIDIDELDIDEYEKLKQRIIDNQDSISFIKEVKCLKCKKPKKLNIGEKKYILDIMSDDTLMSLYKSYNYLTFFGHYTKTDIDNMLPFERNIFIGLLNKAKEDLNKK